MSETKRSDAVGRFIIYVESFHKAHGAVPMRILSHNFGRVLNQVGGFVLIVDELRRDGSINVFMSATGKRVVTPSGVLDAPAGYAPIDGERKSG